MERLDLDAAHGEEKWSAEIRAINQMQVALGPLDDETRRIRAHIGSLVLCEPGIPVTVDELLSAIGRGACRSVRFTMDAGAAACGGMRRHTAKARRGHADIETCLRAYLDGASWRSSPSAVRRQKAFCAAPSIGWGRRSPYRGSEARDRAHAASVRVLHET